MRFVSIWAAILLLGMSACSSSENEDGTSIPSSTAQEQPGEDTTVGVTQSTAYSGPASPYNTVVDWYAALNSEDVDAMAELWPSGDRDLLRLLTEGIDLKVSATCSPGEAGEGSVQCQEGEGRDAFYGPAGLETSSTKLFTVRDGLVTTVEQVDKPSSLTQYEQAFGEWLQETHPDVYESSYSGEGWYPFATLDQAKAVLDLIDDFLAASDDYPVTE